MKTRISTILIPTDFSELSESALKVGIAIAKRQNAEIRILHVVNRYSYSHPPEELIQNTSSLKDLTESMSVKLKEIGLKMQMRMGVRISEKVLI